MKWPPSRPYACIPIVVMIILFAPRRGAAQPTEVALANPSFEEGMSEGGSPVGWKRYLNPGGSDRDRRMSLVETAADGQRALLLQDSDPTGEVGIWQVVPVKPSETYEASVSVRSVHDASSSGAIMLMRFSPPGKDKVVALRPTGHTRFTRIKALNTAPANAEKLALYLYSHRAPTPQLILDDVKLLAGVPPPPAPLPPPPEPAPPVYAQLKDLHLITRLTHDGKPNAVIVVPKSGVYAAPAIRIQTAIRELTAVQVPIVDDTSPRAAVPITGNVIALGNRSTNKAVGELYNRYYTLLDLRYPGVGGYVVRTLHSPFGSGHNVVFVGGSDTAGVDAAADALVAELRKSTVRNSSIAVGRLAEIRLPKETKLPTDVREFEIWEASRGYRSIGYFGWNSISKHMAMYYMTGNEHNAREVIRLAFPDEQALKEIAEIDGERIENKNEPLSGTYHYNSHMMILYWDLVEESPVFSDEERLRVTNAFAKQLLHRKGERVYSARTPPASVGSRHGQWSALSLYCLGRYFQKGYPDPIWQQCEKAGALHFGSLHEYLWVVGEFDYLPWYSTGAAPVLTYMLLTGDRKPLENGVLRGLLRGQEVLTDGSTPDPFLSAASIGFLHKAAHLCQDGRFVQYQKHSGVDTSVFRLGQSYWPEQHLAPVPPDDLLGKWSVLHMSEPEWRSRNTGFDIDATFRFASYRSSADDSGDYVLLKGINRQLRNPYHNFSLLRLRVAGTTLLDGYGTQVYTRADGMVEPKIAMNGALRCRGVVGSTVFATGEVPDLAYCSWKRTLALRVGRHAIIVDDLTFRADSDNIEARISWESSSGVSRAVAAPGVLSLAAGAGPVTVGKGRYSVRAVLASCQTNMTASDAIGKLRGLDIALLRSTQPGEWIELPFELDRKVTGEVFADFLTYADRGVVRLELDGVSVGDERYELRANGVAKKRVCLGVRELGAGGHTLRVVTVAVTPPRKKNYVPLMGVSIHSTSFRANEGKRANTWDVCVSDPLPTTGRGRITTMEWTGPGRRAEHKTFFTAIALNAHDPAERAICSRIAPNVAALSLPEPGVAVAGPAEGVDAELLVLTADHLFAKALRRAGWGGFVIRATEPVDIDLDFSSGQMVVVCKTPSVLETLAGPARQDAETLFSRSLDAGTHAFEGMTPRADWLAQLRLRLEKLVAEGAANRSAALAANSAITPATAPALRCAFTAAVGGPVGDLITIPEAGDRLICAVQGSTVHVLALDGSTKRRLEADGDIRMLRWWDEHELLLAGCADEQVIAWDRAGKRRWVFTSEMDPAVFRAAKTYWFKSAPGHEGIHGLHTGVFLDGRSQAFVGSACTLEIIDEKGKLVKRMPQFWGKVSHFRIVAGPEGSLNLLAARKYAGHGAVRIINNLNVTPGTHGFLGVPKGHTYMRGWSNMSRQHVLYEDVDGDGVKEVITDMNGAWNRITVYTAAGKPLSDVSFGPGRRIPYKNMRDLDIADLDGDGKKEIVSAIDSGLVVALDHRCRKLWSSRMPSPPTAMKIMAPTDGSAPRVVAGCEDGSIVVLDPTGGVCGRGSVKGAPTCIAAVDEADHSRGLVLATAQGEIVLLNVGE